MQSALYEGWVRHRRFKPAAHAFRYALYMAYLDLDELDSVFSKRLFWSSREFNLAWFRREDYMRATSLPGQPLADAVRELVEARIASRPMGPIRLLTHLRCFGFGMNPVSFYYCYNAGGDALHSIVAEINNTPWNEQYAYVLRCGAPVEQTDLMVGQTFLSAMPGRQECLPHHRFRFDKAFHVSPFMDMALRYDWRFNAPGRVLTVQMVNENAAGGFFDSTLVLRRREISTRTLASALVRYPLLTVKVFAAIYFHAARLWVKRCPSFSHPARGLLETLAP